MDNVDKEGFYRAVDECRTENMNFMMNTEHYLRSCWRSLDAKDARIAQLVGPNQDMARRMEIGESV